jgi:hypothetical protein
MPRFTRSEITDRLLRYLAGFEKGAKISYGELTSLGDKITSRSHHLRSARQLLQKEHAQVWVPIPNIGLRRLNDIEIAERLPRWWLKGARRKLGRGQTQATVVDLKALSTDEQTRFAINGIQAELALQSLAKSTVQRLSKVSSGSSNDLPSFNMIEWAITLMPRSRRPPEKDEND